MRRIAVPMVDGMASLMVLSLMVPPLV